MHLTNGPILKNETRTSETCQRSHKSLLKKLFSNDHKHLDKMWSSKTKTFKNVIYALRIRTSAVITYN